MGVKYTTLFEDRSLGFCLTYRLTESQVETDSGSFTRYGASVEKSDGERAEVLDIFSRRDDAVSLITLLYRGLVTPVTLSDVVYDRLCAEE